MGVNPMRQMGIMPTENQDWLSQISAMLTGWGPLYSEIARTLGYEVPMGMPLTSTAKKMQPPPLPPPPPPVDPDSPIGTKDKQMNEVMIRFGFTTPEQYNQFANSPVGRQYIENLYKGRSDR